MPNQATPEGVTMLNEGLLKQLVREFYQRIRAGEVPRVVLHALLHEVYAQGVTAGQQRAQ